MVCFAPEPGSCTVAEGCALLIKRRLSECIVHGTDEMQEWREMIFYLSFLSSNSGTRMSPKFLLHRLPRPEASLRVCRIVARRSFEDAGNTKLELGNVGSLLMRKRGASHGVRGGHKGEGSEPW